MGPHSRRTISVLFALMLVVPGAVSGLPVGAANGHLDTAESFMWTDGHQSADVGRAASVDAELRTIGRLNLTGGDEREQTVEGRIDVGGAIAVDRQLAQSRFELYRLEERVDAAESAADRAAVLSETQRRLDGQIDDLERRERQGREAVNDRQLPAQAYLTELAVLGTRADGLTSVVGELFRYSESTETAAVTDRTIVDLKARLLGLRGPVRDRLVAVIEGESERRQTYLRTSETGVVLATMGGDSIAREYVREAYEPAARSVGSGDRFFRDGQYRLGEAQERARLLYPTAFDEQLAFSVGSQTGTPFLYTAGIYSISVDHTQGTTRSGDLITYIDGGSGDVFREEQYLSVRGIPTETAGSAVTDGLRLEVAETYTGGPLKIQLTANETGDPIAGDISISGTAMGRTGADGQLWVLRPTAPYEVRASARGDTVSVSVG